MVTTLACAREEPEPEPELAAREWVFVELVGRPGGMNAYSCPWFPKSAEFVNWSSRPIRVQALEISLGQIKRNENALAREATPGVPQTLPINITLHAYERHHITYEGLPHPPQLKGCLVTSPARISEAEFAD